MAHKLDTSPLLIIPDRAHKKRRRRAAAVAALMEIAFNMDELEELTIDLGIDWEDIKGETKKEKIRNMVGYYYRLNLLDVFIGNLKAERPDYKWPLEAQDED